MNSSFFEIKKIGNTFELHLNKEIGGKRCSLLCERSEDLKVLGDMCRLNSDFRHLQENAS